MQTSNKIEHETRSEGQFGQSEFEEGDHDLDFHDDPLEPAAHVAQGIDRGR